MYTVSDDYKSQIKQPLRNPSSVKILLDIENAEANDDATVSESTPASPISNASVLNDEYFVNDRIGTMETNRFILDGESSFGKYADQEIYQGYMSQIPSSVANVWTTNPYITIDFSNLQVLDGLSFVFDNLLYGYPDDLRIEAFNGVTPVLDVHVYPDSYRWTYNNPMPPCTKIKLTAHHSSLRYWRFRIEDIIFGIVKQLESDVIVDCNWKQEVDLVDAKLPSYDFSFSFLDIAGEFNPDDDTSLYKYLGRRQRTRFYFGYDIITTGNLHTVFNNDTDNSAGLGVGTDAEYVEISDGKDISFSPIRARYVRLYTNGSTANGLSHYTEVKVFGTENPTTNLASGKSVTASTIFSNLPKITDGVINTINYTTSNPFVGLMWVQIDLGGYYDVNDIKLWHYYGDPRTYHDVIVQLSTNELFTDEETNVEWIKGSEYFTTGEVSVDAQSSIPVVSIKSSSRLYFLTQEYTEGKYTNVPWSLGGLLESLTTFMGINPLYNDILHQYSYVMFDYDAFNVQSTIPLPVLPVNQCLQLLANASLCVMTIDRDGKIVMTPRKIGAEDFALTFTDMYKAPLITKYPQLQGVDTTITMVSNETTDTTIVEKDVVNANYNWYEFKYDGYTDIQVYISGTITIIESEIFDTLTRIVVNGTGTITITGKKKILTQQLYPVEYQQFGERCPISNTLVSTEAHAIAFANWIAEYASCTNQYEIENRGFPELDVNDNITFDTVLNNNLYGTVFCNEISYNGALKGKTKILMAKNLFTTIVNVAGTFNSGQEFILPIGYSK